MYENYEAMSEALARVSKNIAAGGINKNLAPMVFAVTGTGRVADGSMEVLTQLPHDLIKPCDLRAYVADEANKSSKKIVLVQFGTEDMVRHKEGKPYNKKEYREHPEMYEGTFHEFLDIVSWLVCGVYWEGKFPRVLTKEQVKKAIQADKCKMLGVCDISADYEGALEFTSRFTSIEEPFLLYDPIQEEFREKISEM